MGDEPAASSQNKYFNIEFSPNAVLHSTTTMGIYTRRPTCQINFKNNLTAAITENLHEMPMHTRYAAGAPVPPLSAEAWRARNQHQNHESTFWLLKVAVFINQLHRP